MRRSLVLAFGAVLSSAGVVIACSSSDDPPSVTPAGPGTVPDAAPPPPPQKDSGTTARVNSAGNCGTFEAASHFGGPGHEMQRAFGMTSDGAIISTGYANGEVDFGAGKQASTKNSGIFITERDSTFAHVRSTRFVDEGTSSMAFFGKAPSAGGLGVARAPSGGAMIVGGFAGGIDFGGGLLSSDDTWRAMADAGVADAGDTYAKSCTECNRDIFLLEIDAQGKHVSSKRFGGRFEDFAASVAYLPNNGGFVIAGAFSGTLDLGNNVKLTNVSDGFTDAFVARFDATGTAQWARAFAGQYNDEAEQVVVDGTGNVYVTGYFRGTAKLGATDLVAGTEGDAFVVKLDGQGTQSWAVKLGASVSGDGRSLAVDSTGNVVFTGTYKGVVSHGASMLSSSFNNAFVAMLDSQGKPLWAKGWGGMYGGRGSHVIVAPDGGIISTGGVDTYGKLRIDFGGGLVDPVGEDDVYVVELDNKGEHVCSRRIGGQGGRQTPAIALDAAGKITLATSHEGTTTIGPNELTNAGKTDVMFVRMRRKN